MSDQTNLGLASPANGRWSKGWPLAQAFEYQGQAYCFFYQTDGTYEVDVLAPERGAPGWSKVVRGTMEPNYTKLVTYTNSDTGMPYALLYNENTGDYIFYMIELPI